MDGRGGSEGSGRGGVGLIFSNRNANAATGSEQMAEPLSRQLSDALKGSELHLKVAMNTLTFLALM